MVGKPPHTEFVEIAQSVPAGAVSSRRARSQVAFLDRDRLLTGLTMAAVLVGLVALALKLGHFTTFFSVDGDIKYLAALNIAHHPPNPAIPYPFHRFDPSGRFTLPLTAWYNGHDYAGYSLPFEYIAAVFIRLFGSAGIIAPSILATGILLVVQLQLASLIGLRGQRPLLLISTVAATPVLFYAVSFWEHTWGVALLLAGFAILLWLCSREDSPIWMSIPAGVLYAGSVLMRRDTIIPALLSLVVLTLVFRRRRVAVICALAGTTLCLPIAAILHFHPEPLAVGLTHASPGRAGIGSGSGSGIVTKLEWLTAGNYATGLFAIVTAALLAVKRVKPAMLVPLFAVGSVLTALVMCFELLTQFTVADENPLAFCPLAIWGIWSLLLLTDDKGTRRAAVATWMVGVAGAVGVVVMAYGGGDQWGPRYILFVFPLLVLLALRVRQSMLDSGTRVGNRRLASYSFVGLLALSVVLQGVGIATLRTTLNRVHAAQMRVAATHSKTVVSAGLVIDDLAPTHRGTTYLWAPKQRALQGLMRRLRSLGVRRVVVACSAKGPCHWNRYPGWRHSSVQRVRPITRYSIYTGRPRT